MERVMERYGNPESKNVLLQMVDDHDLAEISLEVEKIRELAGENFCLLAIKVHSWNDDLSPWKAPAVFGNEDFGGCAKETLQEILKLTEDIGRQKQYYLGGYSLAGLFALWAAYQTDVFAGIAAASPSMWYPGLMDYMRNNRILVCKVYLSLGDREEKTKNPRMSKVGDCIREGYGLLKAERTECILEWNQGNHFRDPGKRTGKAFAWLLTHGSEGVQGS